MSLNNRDSEKYAIQQQKLLESMTVQMDGRWLKGMIGEHEFMLWSSRKVPSSESTKAE